MGQLAWGAFKKRYVEIGVSKAVVYHEGRDEVPWNDVISITASSEGGKDTSLYADNFIYAKLRLAWKYLKEGIFYV